MSWPIKFIKGAESEYADDDDSEYLIPPINDNVTERLRITLFTGFAIYETWTNTSVIFRTKKSITTGHVFFLLFQGSIKSGETVFESHCSRVYKIWLRGS
jgi:hypothetical protein